MTVRRLAIATGVLVAVDLVVVAAFRNTTDWRLGRFVVWWSPGVLVGALMVTVVAIRPWRWRANALIALIATALIVNAFVIRNPGGSTPCLRPFTHPHERC
jgi:hypothetical protein